METLDEIRGVLQDCLQLGERANELRLDTPLMGRLPELDSMTVVTVLMAIEERFGIIVEDDDISADTFATVGSLCAYIDQRRTT